MNTYNDNLHNTVVASLDKQEIALQTITAKFNAAQDTLYYRQGTRISTYEDLQLASQVLKFYQEAKDKTVEGNNKSINLEDASAQGKSYIENTVSNTATAAANVQLATNAIIKLASDVGSIFSIVNAANFESEIYYQSLKTKERMAETAFNAEAVSDVSMEATQSVANVPIDDFKKRVDQVNASMQGLQTAVDAEYNKANEKVKTDSAKLQVATNNEKKADGEMFVAQREYNSTAIGYNITNLELNLNVNVSQPAIDVKSQSATLQLSFLNYESPFDTGLSISEIAKDPKVYPARSGYFPVEEYNVFVVKYKNKATFGISNAEAIITEYPIPTDQGDKKATDDQYDVRYVSINDQDQLAKAPPSLIIQELKLMLADKDNSSSSFTPDKASNPDLLLLDVDGDPIDLGSQYVVFVMGVFKTQYKKAINNFDDYLSGASFTFKLGIDIPEAKDWNVGNESLKETKSEDKEVAVPPYISFMADSSIVVEELDKLGVDLEDLDDHPVDYRCIILPVVKENIKSDPLLVNSLTTNNLLQSMGIEQIQKERKEMVTDSGLLPDKLDNVTKLGNPLVLHEDEEKIEDLKKAIKLLKKDLGKKEKTSSQVTSNVETEKSEIARLEKRIKNHIDKGETDKAKKEEEKKKAEEATLKKLESELTTLEGEINGVNEDILKNEEAIEKLKTDIERRESQKNALVDPNDIGFLFNEAIAVKIPASNYTLAKAIEPEENKEILPENLIKKLSEGPLNYNVDIGPETTDNFGNRLIPAQTYVPAVLAIFNPGNVNKDKFNASLVISDQTFEYVDTNFQTSK